MLVLDGRDLGDPAPDRLERARRRRPRPAKIDTLLNVMIVLSSFVFSIVMVMLGYAIWKYRAKPGDESDGEPIHGNTRLEIAWTVIPTVIVLFGADLQLDRPRRHRGQRPDRMAIDVTAQQYEWTLRLPGAERQGVTLDTSSTCRSTASSSSTSRRST